MTAVPGPGRRRIAAALAVAVVALMALPAGSFAFGYSALPTASDHASGDLLVPSNPAARFVAPSVHPGVTGSNTTFFTNTPMPLPTKQVCYGGPASGACANITNEPSINYTSTGVLAMAYTAITNASPCPNVSASAQSEIGFVSSTNLGASWSSPVYLGNPVCSDGPAYASAWEPSLTSLGNGTLALVYIEYNMSGTLGAAPFVPYSSEVNTPYARLVFTESYDGGSTWTTPTVLNSSALNASGSLRLWTPERPWISAQGNSVYVTWENFTQSTLYPQSYNLNWAGGASIGSHLVVSTNGGSTWGTPIDLPVTTGLYYPFYEHVAMNPTVLAAPNGSVYVSFTTNVSYGLPCATICLQAPTVVGNVVVGESRDNGSTFRWSTIAADVALNPLWGAFYDPSPQLAVNPTTGQLYATYSAALPGTYCFPSVPVFCGVEAASSAVFFANSSDGGATWSTAHLVDPSLIDNNGGPQSETYNPSLVVDNQGVVHVEMSYAQYVPCASYCVRQEQLYYNSTDNGTTFAGGYILSGNYTFNPNQWDGEYDTMASAGGHLWIAYVQDLCPAWVTQSCYMYSSTTGRAQVTVAEPFRGTGVTLTFTETGVPRGSSWSVDVLGNVRSATAPASIAVGGVPTGQRLNWSLPWENVSYGDSYQGTVPTSTPWVFSANATIPVTYAQFVRVQITTLPNFNDCYGQCLNWNFPTPGVTWLPVGSGLTESVTYAAPNCATAYCDYLNVTWLGWAGVGNGSVSGNQTTISFTANGPINETAQFLPIGVCYGQIPYLTCSGNGTELVQFNESGLPTGTSWSVTADGVTGSSTNGTLELNVPNGTVSWSAWTVPSGATNLWVPTSNQPLVIEVPYTQYVDLTYTKSALTGQAFSVQFNAAGLPSGTNWAANLSGTLDAFYQPNSTATVNEGNYNLSFAPIYAENGTAYTAQSIVVEPFVMNATNSTYGASAHVSVHGALAIFVTFQETVEVTVQSNANGTAGPAQQWVVPGNAVVLHATPNAGYAFAGWSGTGKGATTSAQEFQETATIFPAGPVVEVATFVPASSGRYSATFRTLGIPGGASVTVSLGMRNVSGNGAGLTIGNLSAGWYTLSVPDVYANTTGGTQYEFSTAVASGGTLYPNGTLQVVGNVALNLTYLTKYLVTLAETGPGTISLAAGAYWYLANDTVSVTATPGTGSRFLGWVGSGTGAYTGPLTQLALGVAAPFNEVAVFAQPAGPATFTLTVIQLGLPNGVPWSVLVGALGTSGMGSTLAVTGLNGSYSLTVGNVSGPTAGTQYESNVTALSPVLVTQNHTVHVGFTEQYSLTVEAGSGGSATPSGTTWYDGGATVPVSASASTGESFQGWNGTGNGQYTGSNPSTSITINGPVTELATFAPTVAPPATHSSSGTSYTGLPIALGAFVALLVVGALVGALLARRRPPSDDAGAPAAEAPAAEPSELLYGAESPPPAEDSG
ncbi:MAG: hypothetical protein L3K00_03010 [Thermoplasmata archaeon]|nr:hypothetical protein [Thermoplasmata archaeon]